MFYYSQFHLFSIKTIKINMVFRNYDISSCMEKILQDFEMISKEKFPVPKHNSLLLLFSLNYY